MKKSLTAAALTSLLAITAAAPGSAQTRHTRHHDHDLAEQLRDVKVATARYHRLENALTDGFVAFSLDAANPDVPTCFDSADGGMGVHYVRNIDDVLAENDPEALVYELKNGKARLVAVEYIIPEEFVDPDDPPSLFGMTLHHHSFLPVYVLHAWIWKWNPVDVFADFNPRVGPCP